MSTEVAPAERSAESVSEVVRGGGSGRRAVALVVVGVVVVLGTAAWAVGSSGAEESGLLVRNGDGSIALLDDETGGSVFELENAFPTPDLSTLLTTRADGDDTVLQSRDARSGAVTGSTRLEGALHVRSISPEGGAVVLMPGRSGANLYDPEPRTSTDLTVAYLDDRPAQRFTLDGNIEPEMLSLDETTLFVLEFSPPMDPTTYSVRKLDLASGVVSDTHSIQVDLTSKMAGQARAQVLHPEGKFLYTLYTLPSDQPIHDIEISEDAERYAFVHVISLDEEWSHCIFLPIPFGTTDEATIGMTVSPDGDTVLVGDPAIGQIAEIDARELEVRSVHEVERFRDTGERAVMAFAGDGTAYVSSGQTVLELAPGSFAASHAWSSSSTVTGLSVTDSVLRVASGGSVTLLDRRTRTETAVIDGDGRGTVDLLGPPRGSVTEFPLECAC